MRVSKVSKQQIIVYAGTLFVERGLMATRIEDIASGLGISKKTVYQHFAGKEDLVRAVVANFMQDFYARMQPLFTADLPVIKKIDLLLDTFSSELRDLIPRMPLDLARHYPQVFNELMDKRREVLGQYVHLLRQGQQHNEIRSDFSAETLTAVLIAIVDAIGNPTFITRTGLEFNDVLRLIRTLFLGSLSVQAQEVINAPAL